ncbi:MAG: hypothetical protein K2G99_01755 [Desulfovibrio sp.]|nr:hypothetical protein [Desulfovibrio sp.]
MWLRLNGAAFERQRREVQGVKALQGGMPDWIREIFTSTMLSWGKAPSLCRRNHMTYKEGLVCFIDLLGTKDVRKFATKHALHTAWHTQAHQVEERERLYSGRTLSRKVYSFSDCAYFTYVFKDEIQPERRKPERLFEAMTTFLPPVQVIMDLGFLVRGGISYGKVFVDNLGLFGPAAEESYILESTIANYPRIIIKEELGKKLFKLEVNQEKRLISKDTDGAYYINPFYRIGKNNRFRGRSFDGEEFFEKLKEKYSEIMRKKDAKIKVKWGWLNSKMEAELRRRNEES